MALTIRKDSSGWYNFPSLESEKKTDTLSSPMAFTLPIPLNHLEVKNSEIKYIDKSVPEMYAWLHGLNFSAEMEKNQAYRYYIQWDSSTVEYNGSPFTGGDFTLKGVLNRDRLRIDSLSMQLPGLRFSGNGGILLADTPASITGDFRLTGNPGLLLQIAGKHFAHEFPPVRGELDLALHVKGSLDHPKLNVRLDIPAMNVTKINIHHGFVQAELEPGLVNLDQFRLQVLGGRITGEGKFSPDSPFLYQLSMSADRIDLAEVWQFSYGEASPYHGKITGDFKASGPVDDPKTWSISADVNLRQVKYGSKSLPDFSTRFSFKQGIANFWFNQENSEMSAQVKLKGEKLDGQFSAKILKLEPLAGLLDVSELTGELEIEGVLKGELNSPEVEAMIKGEDIRYQNFPVDSLTASVFYRNGQAYVSKLYFAGNLTPIDTLQPPFHLSNIKGGIGYFGYASGPADSLRGEITINLIKPGYGNVRFDDGLLQIVLDGQSIGLSSLQIRRDSLLIHATGEFNIASANGTGEIEILHVPPQDYNLRDNISDFIQGTDQGQLKIERVGKLTASFDLHQANQFFLQMEGDQLNVEKIQGLFPEPVEIGGLLQFGLDFSGNLDSPKAELDFNFIRPRFQLVEMDSLKGHFILKKDQFDLQRLEIYNQDHYSWATAIVGLEKSESGRYFISDQSIMKGQASGREFDLGLLNSFLPPEMRVSGRGSYDLSWDGTLADLRPIGTLALKEGIVELDKDVPAIQEISLNFSIEDSVLSIDNLSGVIRETPFKLQGKVTASHWKEFNLQMSLSVSNFGIIVGEGIISPHSLQVSARINQMDLSLLQPFFPDLSQLSGTLNTELILSGSTADPQVDGRLEVRGFTLQPSWLNSPFNQGVIKLGFDRNQVNVDSIFMRKNDGTILVSGDLTHAGGDLSSADLKVNIANIKVHRPKELILLVNSAHLTYKNQSNYYLLDGDMVLGESRVLVNFRPQSILPFAQAVERPKQELPSFLQQTRMDVRLRESENIWVDNNLARLRLHPELGIVGSPVQPNLTGRVVVEEGYLLYLDRKFKIKQGVVNFIDTDRLNPIIDFEAATTVKSYRAMEAIPYVITLAITGPLDEVIVELTSDPPLDKSNILSLLTVGATREQFAGKDTEGKDASVSSVLLERAQSISSQKIAGYTSRKVGTLLGLEQFTIEGNLFRFDRSWGPQLLASKKISPRMEITYTTTVGHSNENSFRLDYRLSKHFSLEGQTDQQGKAGMNLKYRLRSK